MLSPFNGLWLLRVDRVDESFLQIIYQTRFAGEFSAALFEREGAVFFCEGFGYGLR